MANRKIQVTLTETMYSEFSRAAEENGVTVATYLRTRAYTQLISDRNAKQLMNLITGMSPEQFSKMAEDGFKEMRERSGSHEQQIAD